MLVSCACLFLRNKYVYTCVRICLFVYTEVLKCSTAKLLPEINMFDFGKWIRPRRSSSIICEIALYMLMGFS